MNFRHTKRAFWLAILLNGFVPLCVHFGLLRIVHRTLQWPPEAYFLATMGISIASGFLIYYALWLDMKAAVDNADECIRTDT